MSYQRHIYAQKSALAIITLITAGAAISACSPTQADSKAGGNNIDLMNVSYDVSRDFYKDYNPLFADIYTKANPNAKVNIKQSHGGASKQSLAVANGLQADVITLNQESDMNMLVDKGLVDSNWRSAFPDNAVPYTTTMILLVRKDNPKNIKGWQDLARSDVKVIMPNPKTSGTARYAFLGAYGAGLHKFNETKDNAKQTDAYMKKLLGNVVTYDNGARAATTSFTQRGLGDVLITTENEAHLVVTEHAKGAVDVVYPNYSITIHNPVAIVKTVTDKKGTTKAATDYLKTLWDKPAQELMAKLYLRPSDKAVLAANSKIFQDIDTFEATEVFGDWDSIMKNYFADGARFDQLAQNNANK